MIMSIRNDLSQKILPKRGYKLQIEKKKSYQKFVAFLINLYFCFCITAQGVGKVFDYAARGL